MNFFFNFLRLHTHHTNCPLNPRLALIFVLHCIFTLIWKESASLWSSHFGIFICLHRLCFTSYSKALYIFLNGSSLFHVDFIPRKFTIFAVLWMEFLPPPPCTFSKELLLVQRKAIDFFVIEYIVCHWPSFGTQIISQWEFSDFQAL